ncbi:hypothetical protein N657DRAFT_672364 [Parathielavia appendiculata]|uniref:Uncharacterized protein n=1 Tax=Parathielavia appendiculata TaxID=2587402 RepID=A0AAN6TZ11_9PEZI|nr:hypothetical protein N657DRAFT_672364 [Parathielavia appendiculata]
MQINLPTRPAPACHAQSEQGDRILEAIERLEQRMKASEANAMARLINSHVWLMDEPIEPLCSVLTGELIPDFPRSVKEIEDLDMEQVDAILDHLQVYNDGDLEDGKKKIQACCGVISECGHREDFGNDWNNYGGGVEEDGGEPLGWDQPWEPRGWFYGENDKKYYEWDKGEGTEWNNGEETEWNKVEGAGWRYGDGIEESPGAVGW